MGFSSEDSCNSIMNIINKKYPDSEIVSVIKQREIKRIVVYKFEKIVVKILKIIRLEIK